MLGAARLVIKVVDLRHIRQVGKGQLGKGCSAQIFPSSVGKVPQVTRYTRNGLPCSPAPPVKDFSL